MEQFEVLIIESRSPQDIYDGRLEAEALEKTLKLQGVKSKKFEVINKDYLAKALTLAANEHVKYVHISAHGSESGIALTDGSFVSWKELDEIAWPHLKDTCLCFSSCDVGKGAETIFNHHKSFCNAIVAPVRPVYWGESLVAFSALYLRAQSKNSSTAQDTKVLNHIVGAGTFKLIESPYKKTTYTIGN